MKKVNESKHVYERGTWYVCERERERRGIFVRERRGTFVRERETWYVHERETWYVHKRDS